MNEIALDSALSSEETKERLKWMIKLRWAGCVEGLLISTHVFNEVAHLIISVIPIYLVLGFVAIYNIYFQHQLKLSSLNLRRNALLQVTCDYIALTTAVYLTGSCSSPFLYFFIFHVIISGLILPKRWTFSIAAFAMALPALVVTLTHFQILPFFSVLRRDLVIAADVSTIAPYGVVFASTLILTAYFVTYLGDRLHKSHAEIKKLYYVSERLRSSLAMEKVIEIIQDEMKPLCNGSTILYMSLDKKSLSLVYNQGEVGLAVPISEGNAFKDALMSGEAHIIESMALKSKGEERVFERLMKGSRKIAILPVQGSFTGRCRDFFCCPDTGCHAYAADDRRCWYISGTHCRGSMMRSELEKLKVCVDCEMFMPVGIFLVDITQNSFREPKSDIAACLRLMKTASHAICNARLYEKTQELCRKDRVTGVRNRRAVRELLDAEIPRASQYGRTFGFVTLNIDHFRNYTAKNGLQQGNMLLNMVGGLIAGRIRKTDTVGRHGEAGFIIFLPDTSKDGAVTLTEDLQRVIEEREFPRAGVQPGGEISISAGISSFPEDGNTAGLILEAAERRRTETLGTVVQEGPDGSTCLLAALPGGSCREAGRL